MSDGEAYSPFRSILLVLTHDYIITCVYGPTGSDGHEWVIPKRTLVAHHFRCRMWRRVWCTSRGPCDHLFGPQHELPPADLCPEQRRGRGMVQTRSGILAHLCTRQHWLWVTVEPHITSARHEEVVAREGGRYAPVRRVSGSEPLSLRKQWTSWSVTPAQECRCRVPGSISSGLTPTLREDWACSGHSRHPVMQGSPPAHGTPRPYLRTTSQN